MSKENKCDGCEDEMNECYIYQSMGYDAGLTWEEGHCFLFVFDKKGGLVVY